MVAGESSAVHVTAGYATNATIPDTSSAEFYHLQDLESPSNGRCHRHLRGLSAGPMSLKHQQLMPALSDWSHLDHRSPLILRRRLIKLLTGTFCFCVVDIPTKLHKMQDGDPILGSQKRNINVGHTSQPPAMFVYCLSPTRMETSSQGQGLCLFPPYPHSPQ